MQRKGSAPPPVRWDDIQMFVALLQQPSLTKAATSLGIDTSTLSRRLAALEERLGLSLFDRSATGVRLTAAAEKLAAAARTMETSALAFVRESENFERKIEGTVRITAPPAVVEGLLVPALPRLAMRYSRVLVELDASTPNRDIERRETDIAIRTRRPDAGTLVCKKVYCGPLWPLGSAPYVREQGVVRDLSKVRWVGVNDRSDDGLAKHLGLSPAVIRGSSLLVQIRAAAEGMGLVWTARHFSYTFGLEPLRVTPPVAKQLARLPPVELWLVAHASYKSVARLAAVWSFLEEEMSAIATTAAHLDRAAAR